MSTPFYVSPEQMTKDRAEFARKGVGRGRPAVLMSLEGCVLLAASNHSQSLRKVSEIYDRIAFAAVGRYNEFENLRVAGIRYADLRGYSYDRSDVSARGLANAYAQTLATVFATEAKPLEVEIALAQLGRSQGEDQFFRIGFDGSIADEADVMVMGGGAEGHEKRLRNSWHPGLSLAEGLELALGVLREGSEDRIGTGLEVEAAILDRERSPRAFRRLTLGPDGAAQ